MKNLFASASILAVTATGAFAGGIDRSGQGIGIIFEDGGYVELSFGMVMPNVSGSILGGALPSGDMAGDYAQFGLGVKQDINDKLSVAIILDQPFGASVDYPAGAYPLGGTTATISSQAITAMGRYMVGERTSIHAGLRIQNISGVATIVNPLFPADYLIDMSGSTGVGYSVGAAYEIPDIALRVALTYNSAISHTMSGVEGFLVAAPATDFDVTTPQSVNLDFQSGIAEDTLLFGSVRWVDWTSFVFAPVVYFGAAGNLIDYDNDVITYTLGVGRKFSDTFSGSVSVSYEESTATAPNTTSNLSPTDGFFSVQLGGKYTMNDNMTISGGIRYVMLGDATTESLAASFTDNSAIGVGIKVGYSF